jgi:hypothetical protein
MTEAELPVARVRMLPFGRRYAFPLPDVLMALIFVAAAALDFLTPEQLASVPSGFLAARDELIFVMIVEGGFLMMQATLVDIATRLKKRPPVWVVAIIVAVVALFSMNTLDVLKMAWERGSLVFVPLLVSLAERGTVLWTMPTRSRIEKIAARALVANRITTGLVLFALITLMMVVSLMTVFMDHYDTLNGAWVLLAPGAFYFAVAAFDDWRVRGRRFAEKPSVLFGFDPIHIEYLVPV